MKSYLSLIPISARVRRRQNRLTILCIVTAVFLVTAIFSVADMMLRTQTGRAAGKSGSWHLEVTGITPEQAAQLVGQPDVVRVGAGAVFNENGESAYRLNGKRVVLYGADADYVSLNRAAAFAGTYPQAENEVLLGKTAARVLHVGSGDTVTLTLPDGTEKPLTVTGVGGIDEDFYGEQYSIVDAYLPQEAFAALLTANGEALPQTHYELEYTSAARAAKALPKLRSRYGETAVQENLQVMGSAGQSSSTAFQTVYGMAAVLFVLVLQQFDGNILGPKILGESTGLPSFWVLFSILLFGGLLGFVGMVIAVPTFAVFYHLTSEYVNRCLEKKALSQSTDDYRDLDYIDEAGNEYIERKE